MFGPVRLRLRIGTTRRMAQIGTVQYHEPDRSPVLAASSYRMGPRRFDTKGNVRQIET
jgi:hypothetical protein